MKGEKWWLEAKKGSLTLGTHAQRGLWYLIRLCVCLSVRLLPHFLRLCATRQRTAKPTDSSLHWLNFEKGDFHITTAFKSYDVKSKPICKLTQAYLDRVHLLCMLKAQEVQRRACIDSSMPSTTVASLCQTLHELLAWRPWVNAY